MLWTMTSASGREQFVCARTCASDRHPWKIFEISISGNFWNRGDPIQTASMVLDFRVHLPQVLVSEDGIATLSAHLGMWLEDQSEFECVVSPVGQGDQLLSLALGYDPGLIYSKNKPAFIVSYSRGPAMSGRWAFVVDQSCIRRFLDDLSTNAHSMGS